MIHATSTVRFAVRLGLLAAAAAGAATAQAQEAPRNVFDFAITGARMDTDVRASGVFGNGSGTWVSAEDDLGLDKWSGLGSFSYRRLVGQNWHFGVDYLFNSRREEHALPRAASIMGTSYAAGAVLRTRLELGFLGLNAGYALVNDGASRIGVDVGAYGLAARLTVRPPNGGSRYEESSGDAVPMVGVFASTVLGSNLRFEGQARFGQASGSKITEAHLQLLWRATPNVDVGGGWRHTEGRITDDRNDFFNFSDTQVRFKMSGPQVVVRLAF